MKRLIFALTAGLFAVTSSSPPAQAGAGDAVVSGIISGVISGSMQRQQPQRTVVVHDRVVVHDKPVRKAVPKKSEAAVSATPVPVVTKPEAPVQSTVKSDDAVLKNQRIAP
jgi:hypothetical protein